MRRPGLLLLVLAACGRDPAVDHVQPDRLQKSQLAGEWYFRQTVIDVPYASSVTREGFATRLERVSFDIQEHALIAVRSIEHVEGAGGGLEPVAAWSIVKHFDVATEHGEDRDIRFEDDLSRPWWERAWIRVDWSRDLLPRSPGVGPLPGELVTGSGADGWVQGWEEGDPDRLDIEPGAMSVVGLYTMAPDPVACARFVDAMWGTGDTLPCAPTTVRRRTSFVRIDPAAPPPDSFAYPDTGPLAADLDGDGRTGAGEVVGPVLTICASGDANGNCAVVDGRSQVIEVECTPQVLEALSRDPYYSRFRYGPADCKVPQERYFDRFGFARTERPVFDPAYGLVRPIQLIDRWNPWERTADGHGAPIPYAQRTPRPIVFHASAGFPPELLSRAQDAARQWGQALLETVAALQGRPVESYGDLQMVQVRENHCTAAEVRRIAGGSSRLREAVQRVAGSLETLGGEGLERACAALEMHSDFRWEKPGDLRHSMIVWVDRPQQDAPVGYAPVSADPLTGEIVAADAWVYGPVIERQAAMGADVVQLIRGDLQVADVIRGEDLRSWIAAHGAPGGNEDRLDLPDLARRAEHAGTAPPPGAAQSGLDLLADDPALERTLVDEEDLRHAGWSPGDPIDPELVKRAGPRGAAARDAERERTLQQLGSGDCLLAESFVDPGVVGLAVDYDAADLGRDEIVADLRGRIFSGVLLHELGHALGLRHNLAGSYDALNYPARFWQLQSPSYRESIQDTLAAGQATPEDAAALQRCLDAADRWGTPPPTTFECLHGPELKTSSVMDYAARFNSRFSGIGPYDRAAIRFGYGHLLDVFGDDIGLTQRDVDFNLLYKDYKEIPAWLGGARNIGNRRWMRLPDLVKARVERIRAGSSPDALPVLDPDTGACSANCSLPPVDPVEVPYRSCSDEAADFKTMDCHRWDEGASAEEVVDAAIRRWEVQLPFTAFRRGRPDWTAETYLRDLRERTLAPIAGTFWKYLYYGRYTQNYFLGYSLANASWKGLNFVTRMMAAPASGWYCRDSSSGAFYSADRWGGSRCGPTFEGDKIAIPGVGRSYWATYGQGSHAEEESVGTGRDRREALRLLTDSSVGYWQLFRPELIVLLTPLITGEEAPAGSVFRTLEGLVFLPQGSPAPAGSTLVGPVFAAGYGDVEIGNLAATYAFTSLSSPDDGQPDAADYFVVDVKGLLDDPWYPGVDRNDPNAYVEMTDPFTRRVYFAVNTGDGMSITHRLLTLAKDYLERYYEPARERLDAAETGTVEYNTAREDLGAAESSLRVRIEQLDRIRSLRKLVEFRN